MINHKPRVPSPFSLSLSSLDSGKLKSKNCVPSFPERRDLTALAKSIFSPPLLTGDAVNHGKVKEESAIAKFAETTGKKVEQCGLSIDLAHPFLAATPDGAVVGEDALVEVKCPYTGRNSKIAKGKLFPCLELRDGELKLRRNHNYFYQVQAQMKICGKSFCYFVVFTNCDMVVEKIEFDASFFSNQMLPFLQKFYDDHYMPCIVQSF
jgi:predicted phage-related endonuclease